MLKTIIKGFLAGVIASILAVYIGGLIPNPGLPFWGSLLTGILVVIIMLILEKFLKL